ncbi:nitrite reductase (NO-forming) [Flavimobilis soli]|uniref:Copper-containing nitrite reductase n=1 Tax=Flavimobilis soli TaxID=442709 RepID=A0A2A9EF58_9MICO|nr:multicopper oxidase domain-containing protein [Flavimobilis soli]PFG37544.1 nitrite reductase (NO-forming) [Flavimobilis soli]
MTTPATARPLSARSTWHLGANAPVVGWLTATVVVAVAHREIPASTWLLVHMTLLGAVTNAVCVWSAHFADALLRRRVTPASRRWQAARLVVLNVGVVTTVVGMVASRWTVTLVGAVLVGLAVAAHAVTLGVQSRSALAPRFLVCVRFYVAAGALLPLGAALGVLLARGGLGTGWHVRLVLAHAGLNLLGFVGLTVLGTLVTLWPTMLRTAMDAAAPRAARRTLVLMLAGLALGVAGALGGVRLVAAAGVVAYVAGVAVSLAPMVASARRRPPSSFATWSAAAATAWFVGSLVWLAALLVAGPTWDAVSTRVGALVAPLVGGFAAQLVLGALTYLVPVVLGGGPATVRATAARLERGAVVRVVVANGGLLLFVLPGTSTLAALASIAALVALATFLPLLGLALRDHRRARRAAAAAPAQPRPAPAAAAPPRKQSGALVAGVSVLLLVVAGATAIDPPVRSTTSAAGQAPAAAVAPTGRTTTVTLETRDMTYTPSRVSVPAGDRLVLTITNTDTTTIHDLLLDTGAHSGRIGVGETVTVDVGVVDRTIEGWCTIVGHKQSGMRLTIVPTGLPASGGPHTATDGGAHTGHEPAAPDGSAQPAASAAADVDLSRTPATGFAARDPHLAPATDDTVHRFTLEVADEVTEVAPGVTQTLWTFGGSAPGPVIRGKVGDRFEITLVNDGSIGHSVDFHAGALAPDEPMRTIAPGDTLTYRFTATRSGIWMYHCSTAPMSAHIANGMMGAVVIDPPDLAPVDHELVLVQSEMYLGPQGGEVDAERVASGQPDLVVFNGYADGYLHDPIEVGVGERVRVWVLAAGPNVGSSFHVVGGQFDTVFHEGAYRLRPGGTEQGGSQALGLTVAQGGFVELELPEPGTYPFVTHAMSDAERGARGAFVVTP